MPKNPQRFKGLLTNVDLKDVPPGCMVEQTNIGNYRPGRLDVRKGVRFLNDSDLWNYSTSGSSNFIATFGFTAPQARFLIHENALGTVKAIRDTASSSIITGLNAAQPISCTVDQYGHLIVVNGIERGYRWNGVASSPDALGVDSPIDLWGSGAAGTPYIDGTFLPGTGNVYNDSKYYCAYRYVDKDGIPSSISELYEFTTETGASGTKIQWLPGPSGGGEQIKASTQGRVETIELWRSVRNDARILYKVREEPNSTWASPGSSFVDDISDADLLASDPDSIMEIFTADRLPNAERFAKPPTCKPFVALHQDVLWMYGRVFYDAGTFTATNSSGSVTGSATSLRTEMNGWKLRFTGETTEYTISGINEGTQAATLTPVYAGSTGSGKTYVLSPDVQTEAYNAWFSVKGEPESMPESNQQRIQSSAVLNDIETGLFAFGSYIYFFHERTFYQASFGTNPVLDFSVSPAFMRGAVNNACIFAAEGSGWAMDQLGAYRFGSGGVDDISTEKMRDYFRTRIDWTPSKRKWYFGSYDPHDRVVRWHVNFSGDSETRPRRAICYNILTGEWWDEKYPTELCGGAVIEVDGLQRLVCGGTEDHSILFGEGTADNISAAIQGSPTSAVTAGSSLTDSTANFSASVVGAPVTIIEGTGKGQTRIITFRSSSTLLLVDTAWTIGLDSVYVIGAINWSFKTAGYELVAPQSGQRTAAINVNRMLRMQHLPTTNHNLITLQLYADRSASALDRGMPVSANQKFIKYQSDEIEVYTEATRGYGGGDQGYTPIPLDGTTPDESNTPRIIQFKAYGSAGLDAFGITAFDVIGYE